MRVRADFTIDLMILLLFLVGFEPALTGGMIHEWLNLTFAAGMLIHLLMHWDWIRATLRWRPRTLSRLLTINLFLNILSFLVLVMMISRNLWNLPLVTPSLTAVEDTDTTQEKESH